jgi:hypothetical protein
MQPKIKWIKHSKLSLVQRDKLKRDLYKKQRGKCALCGTWREFGAIRLDHCHNTDTVRLLLCSPCNTGLGFLRDNPVVLRKAANYVRRYFQLESRRCLACGKWLSKFPVYNKRICVRCGATSIFDETIVKNEFVVKKLKKVAV